MILEICERGTEMKAFSVFQILAFGAAILFAGFKQIELAFAAASFGLIGVGIEKFIMSLRRKLLVVPCRIEAGTLSPYNLQPTHNIYVGTGYDQKYVYIELRAVKIGESVPKSLGTYFQIVAGSRGDNYLDVESRATPEDRNVGKLFL